MKTRNLTIVVLSMFYLTIAQAAEPRTLEGNRAYTERVHTYANGNSIAIKVLGGRISDNSEAIQREHEYTKKVHGYVYQNSQGIQHLAGKANQTDLEIEGLKSTDKRQDKTLADHGIRLDTQDVRFDNYDRQVVNMQEVNSALNTRLNGAYERLDQHSAQIARLERRMDKAEEANAVALAIAGHQFDTKGDFQVAISGSTIHRKHAVAVGVGGAINDRVFLNAGMSRSGSTTGGVMSTTISW